MMCTCMQRNYPQNKLLSTWKLRKRVMEKQKRQSASMLQRQEGKYLRVVMWGQQEIMKGETEYKIKGTLNCGVFRSEEEDT